MTKKDNNKIKAKTILPKFGCDAVKDICSTCKNLEKDGHCKHEEIVSVDGCNYHSEIYYART